MTAKAKLAVWKFSSCDGCQLSLLDCEDELLLLAAETNIAYFMEATRRVVEGPYDISLVEGSITTEDERERILEVRRQSKTVVTIGACATAGGIQALRNFADVDEFISQVYAHPDYISTLKNSTAIADHIKVDYQLRGCPVNKHQLLEVLSAFLNKRRPAIRDESVCNECKLSGKVCIMVAQGKACFGPVTHAGCGALCPGYSRGCYGCYGPKENCNPASLSGRLEQNGLSRPELSRLFRSFNAAASEFEKESLRHEENH